MSMQRAVIAALMMMCLFLGPARADDPEGAGYILVERHVLWGDEIWGIGESLDDARDDARRQGANLDHDGEEMDDWLDGLKVRRATAELMAAARQNKWALARELGDGVWGTPAEYAARLKRSSRVVLPRDLMTWEERAAFRSQLHQALPAERQALWLRQLAVLKQRAATRGLTLAVPALRPDGRFLAPENISTAPARPGSVLRSP